VAKEEGWMSVQKFIFPGLIVGIICVIGLTSLLAATPEKARKKQTSSSPVQQVKKNNSDRAAHGSDCAISSLYPDSIQRWCSFIEQYARENSLDPNLVSAVMLQESSGQADAYSKSGAVGLLQVMPRDGKASGFMCKNGPCFEDRPSMHELYDPEFNIAYGTKMLSDLISQYGDLREALKAYGPKDVGYYYADIILNILNSRQ